MKKMFHRIGAMAVALMMALSLAVPAMATTTTGDLASRQNTVKVNDAVEGAEYKLYKLLQLDGVFETKGEGDTQTTSIVSYRYSYDPALEATIGNLVKQDAFRYEPKTEGDTNPRHGFGFKVDDHGVSGDSNKSIVTFITPAIVDSTTGDVDYDSEANSIVRTMMVEFADELRKLVDANSLTPFGDSVTATGTTVSFENVPSGYWMVTSNAGARSIVFTNPGADLPETMNVYEKNPAPTVDKKVFDADDMAGSEAGGSWKDVNDAKIGDEVKFKVTVDLYKGAENIAVHDEMTEGLTFKAIEGVKFFPRSAEKNADGTAKFERVVYKLTETGAPDPTNVTTPDKGLELTGKTSVYTVDENPNNTRGFILTFKNAFTNPAADAANRDQSESKNNVFLGDLSTLEDDGGRLVIEYTAIVNENAVSGGGKLICLDTSEAHVHGATCYEGDGNGNDSYVKYGHISGVEPGKDPETPTDPPNESTHDETKTFTYEFSIDKFVKDDENTKLADATFELRPNFVGIGTESVTKGDEKYAWVDGGNLKLPASEYTIPETGDGAVAAIPLVRISDDNTGTVYRVAKDGDTNTTTEIKTNASGKITVKGPDSNLYSIKEIHSPKGYLLLEKPVMIAVGSAFSGKGSIVFTEGTKDGDTYTFTPLDTTTVGIENASGIQMPTTGGVGTTIFYVIGGVLILGAGVLLVLKKRAGRTED